MIKNSLDSRSKIITLRIPKELDDLLDDICRELGYDSKSEFVREAISEYIDHLANNIDDNVLEEPMDDIEVSVGNTKVIIV